jgi:hypothetical protein
MTGPDAPISATATQSPNDVWREPSVVRSRERSTIVFSGEQVGAGFAIALALMEAHENLLVMSDKPDTERD